MTRLETAETRAAAARARLKGTVGALQAKVAPREVARTAADSGIRALATGADAARANPGKVIGAIAVLGALLGRKRIASLVRKAVVHRETPSTPARSSRRTKD